ncbi:uncharacterized protein PRCAT00002163001 [Priceomyces carsonii]|uniref:uncharacterized protein n=1 Tax=Priceomyces carsonii TaxID=28549 RepID=UPI002ED77968|nr:unnamed protein product [Priceomyces carsonii]
MAGESHVYSRGHESEYVLIRSSRKAFPISSRSESVSSSRCNTPVRFVSPSNRNKMNLDLNSQTAEYIPTLKHKWSHTHSILCVLAAPSKKVLFCGTQDSKLLIFDMENYNLKFEINCGHMDNTASILCLALSDDENHLFSAGSNSLVSAWDVSSVNSKNDCSIVCTHIVYSALDIGDIFSIAWSQSLSTLFIGAQNASILWCQLDLAEEKKDETGSTMERLPHLRYDKFFDSKGPGGLTNFSQTKYKLTDRAKKHDFVHDPKLVEVGHNDLIRFAHYGYVYCMEIFDTSSEKYDFLCNYSGAYKNILISCGGDGVVNIFGVNGGLNITISKLKSLDNLESILSMTVQNSYLYLGLCDSSLKVWDLMTLQLIRSFEFTSDSDTDAENRTTYDEVLSLGICNDCIFKASNLGGLIKFSLKRYTAPVPPDDEKGNNNHLSEELVSSVVVYTEDETYNHLFNSSYCLENGAVLAIKIFTSGLSTYLLSGGHKSLCLWDITSVAGNDTFQNVSNPMAAESFDQDLSNGDLINSLRQFISFRTILKCPTLYLEDSRQCAQFLTKLFITLGSSQTKLLPVTNGNPVVYAKFSKNTKEEKDEINSKRNARILWYAHYDVVDAESEDDSWSTDPFTLVAKDGNVYARGVSDNKAPTLAAMYAVSELHLKGKLSCDVVFVVEGEEECGSIGFQNVINENKALIGNIDWVLLSNSYWIDDETPCLNYGLRGVINASITVESDKPDRHSGVDGGVLRELTMDLIHVLSQLTDPKTGKINLEGFYDDILPLTEREIDIYRNIEKAASSKDIVDQDLKTLIAKWRDPSLTIHKIQVSGPNNNTVIPKVAKASVSMRIVPNQDIEKIKALLINFVNERFNDLGSENHLLINIFHEAEPWLGDPSNLVYQILYEKIKEHWGPKAPDPLFIREGGSIPSVRFLEKCFDAPAAQIPCGQASDNAHLKDEKLRLLNLFKLRSILTDSFEEIGNSN